MVRKQRLDWEREPEGGRREGDQAQCAAPWVGQAWGGGFCPSASAPSLCVCLSVDPPSCYLPSLHLFPCLDDLCLFSFPPEEASTGV